MVMAIAALGDDCQRFLSLVSHGLPALLAARHPARATQPRAPLELRGANLTNEAVSQPERHHGRRRWGLLAATTSHAGRRRWGLLAATTNHAERRRWGLPAAAVDTAEGGMGSTRRHLRRDH